MKTLEKIFSPLVLLLINIGLILVIEFTGTFFFDTSLIHGIAILFIILAFTRIFSRHRTADPMLKKLLDLSLVALFIFAGSHFIEFLSSMIFGEYGDVSFVNVINMYLASLLFIVAGTEYVLRAAGKRHGSWANIMIALGILLVGFTGYTILMHNPDLISLDVATPTPYLYIVAVLIVAIIAMADINAVRRSLPPLNNFSVSMLWAVACVALAALLNSLYGLLADVLKVPDVQIIYLSHFIFYASISVMFLAFGKTENAGVYQAQEQKV